MASSVCDLQTRRKRGMVTTHLGRARHHRSSLSARASPGSERDAQVKHYEGAGEGRGRGCTLAVTLTIKNVTTPVPNTRTVNQRTRSRRRERIAVAPTEIDCERPERDLPEHPEAEQHDAVARDQPEVGAREGHLLLFPSPLPKPDQGSAARMQTTMLVRLAVRRQQKPGLRHSKKERTG